MVADRPRLSFGGVPVPFVALHETQAEQDDAHRLLGILNKGKWSGPREIFRYPYEDEVVDGS